MGEFGELAGPYISAGVGIVEFLGESRYSLCACGVGEKFEFVEIFGAALFGLVATDETHEHRPLVGFIEYYIVFKHLSLLFASPISA